MKKISFAAFCLILLLCTAHAADYREAFRKLTARAAEQSKKYWQGKHFGEHPYPDNATVYEGRNVHDYTMMYWNFMDAKLNGSNESRNRALAHYEFTVAHFWDKEKKRFRTGYDFLANTSIMMSTLLSLRDAREVIPEQVQNDMRLRCRAISAYLPTYTTALLNNRDLRANNQDAFAAFALAVYKIVRRTGARLLLIVLGAHLPMLGVARSPLGICVSVGLFVTAFHALAVSPELVIRNGVFVFRVIVGADKPMLRLVVCPFGVSVFMLFATTDQCAHSEHAHYGQYGKNEPKLFSFHNNLPLTKIYIRRLCLDL